MIAKHRISVTTLESFRRYMVEASPYDTEERLVESIKGIFVGNPKTMFGAAYHAMMEGKFKEFDNGLVWAGGHTFTTEQASPVMGYRRRHPQITSEVNVRSIYQTSFFPIQISGRVDALEGLVIRDGKTKFRRPDFQEYLDSCQWKFYSDILKAEAFFYDVFEVKGFPDDADMRSRFYPEVQVCEVKSVMCTPYSGMKEELTEIINDFIGFVNSRNLWQYIKPAYVEVD